MKAIIFDIERNSFVDGPGIRTTVFFKGCNLKCKWCHNPESVSPKKQILFYRKNCTNCGKCKFLTVDDKNFICFNDAKEICGKEYTSDALLTEIIKDKTFYENSGGGATFSGGECMLQIDFLLEILQKCKANNIHTAVDTAGHVPWDKFEMILPYVDLFLYDIKTMNDEIHKRYTSVTNTCILENLAKLLKSDTDVWVRIPVIPGVNDSKEDMQNIHKFFCLNGYPQKVELLPYHAMGEHKYAALGKQAEKFDVPDEKKIGQLKLCFTPEKLCY